MAASRSDGACGVRTWPKKSKASIATMAAIVRAQTQVGTSMQRFLRSTDVGTGGLSRREPRASRPAAPEAMGPRTDDTAAGDTPLHGEPVRARGNGPSRQAVLTHT